MKIYSFFQEQWLPQPPETVFPFFADAANLEAITPPWVGFQILTPGPIEMKTGAIIDYRIRIHGFPVRWRTKITVWDPPFRFADEQLKGPYRRWFHTHSFEEKDGGTLCRDRVDYAVPGGALINRLLIRGDIEKIFAHRRIELQKRFPGPPALRPFSSPLHPSDWAG